jgi:hypothetical protein
MAAPTASASLNKSAYTPGELITLTIDHSDVDRSTLTVSGTVTDSTGAVGNWSATAVIDAGTVAIVNSGGKTWTLQSATSSRSVFTATA